MVRKIIGGWVMKRAIALLAVIALSFTMGCQGSKKESSPAETVDNKTIGIGVVISKTGSFASIGLQEEKALILEMDRINNNGGVQGKKLNLIVEDDASEASNAGVAISKLINEDKVSAIIGSTSADATLAMKPKANEAKVPLIALSSDMKITESPADYVFRAAQPDRMAIRKVLDYMYKSLLQKFAVIHEDTAFGKSGADELNKLAKGARLSVTSTQPYSTDEIDMTKQLKKIALTSPKAIVVWGSSNGAAIIAKNMKELNLNVPLIGSPSIANKAFIELAGDNAEGVVFPAGKMIIPESAEVSQTEVINNFKKNYQEKYGEMPSLYAGYAYDAVHILVEAIDAAEGDMSLLKLELSKTWGYVGTAGVFTYSAEDHDGLKSSDIIMVEIKNGEWVLKTL
jgi:branched-chain amino acid transport system substrate-binding protein